MFRKKNTKYKLFISFFLRGMNIYVFSLISAKRDFHFNSIFNLSPISKWFLFFWLVEHFYCLSPIISAFWDYLMQITNRLFKRLLFKIVSSALRDLCFKLSVWGFFSIFFYISFQGTFTLSKEKKQNNLWSHYIFWTCSWTVERKQV